MPYQPPEADELKIIYQEIIEGCSPVSEGNYYIKHLTDVEQVDLLRKKIEIYNSYLDSGAPSETARLKELAETNEWTQDDEDKIASLKYLIKDNERNLPTIIAQQQGPIRKIIDDSRVELYKKVQDRQGALGITADYVSEKDAVNYLIFASCYNDRACKDKRFASWTDFEAMDEDEINFYVRNYDSVFAKFRESNLRKISVLAFFLNTFSFSKESFETFLGKPIIQLTPYQLNLFSLGSRNLSILNQTTGEPPELVGDTKIDDIVTWFDQSYSVLAGKRKSEKS
jgi:hypothetical protein